MSAWAIFQFVTIALIVGWSANRVIRQYAPATHRQVRGWLAAKLHLKLAQVPAAAGCDSGCGSCATGCGSTASKPAAEESLHFHPRKH